MPTIAERILEIQHLVTDAAAKSGRKGEDIEIMAVTKTKPWNDVQDAIGAGITLFGENRVIEAREKYTRVAGSPRLHLIGHLQRNKAKLVPGLFSAVESIDKVETAIALNAACRKTDQPIEILIEFNTSGEESKSGYTSRDQLLSDMDTYLELPFTIPVGLMTIGPFTEDQTEIRTAFASLRTLLVAVQEQCDLPNFSVLSMGMTSDFQAAILEGSTRVRLGSAIFGARS